MVHSQPALNIYTKIMARETQTQNRKFIVPKWNFERLSILIHYLGKICGTTYTSEIICRWPSTMNCTTCHTHAVKRTLTRWYESHRKRQKMQQPAGRYGSVLRSAWNSIYINYLEKATKIKSENYMAFDRFKEQIKKNVPELQKKKMLLHQDSSPSH